LRRKFVKTPGTIELVYGPIIETTGRKAEEVLALTKDWIEGTMVKLAAKHQKTSM
jgi:1-acyl-sn-glycerol-3-phosphate acyltransferase